MAHFDSLDAVPAGRLRDAIARQLDVDARRRRKPRAEPEPAQRVRDVTVDPLHLVVPCRPWSLNERDHWSVRSERVLAVRAAVVALVPREAGRYAVPVEVEATTTGARLDALNDAVVVKAAVDGLRDAGILVDDSARWVRRYIMNAPVPDAPFGLTLIVRVLPDDA